MTVSEYVGKILGYPLGALAFIISFLRSSRTFHPSGILAEGHVQTKEHSPVTFHSNALVRFSSALWKKNQKLPDVLGISIRFSENRGWNSLPLPNDQDLLFATIRIPAETPLGPFRTDIHRFQRNKYYAVSPFICQNKKIRLLITLDDFLETKGNRNQNLRHNINTGSSLRLWMKINKKWIEIATIQLKGLVELNQEKLFFNPFRSGLGIRPQGFIHHLRYAVYPMSQFGRSLRHALNADIYEIHNT